MCPMLMDCYVGGGHQDRSFFQGYSSDARNTEEPELIPGRLKIFRTDLKHRLIANDLDGSIPTDEVPPPRPLQPVGDAFMTEDPLDLAVATIEALDPHHLNAVQMEGKQEWEIWRHRFESGLMVEVEGHLSGDDTLALVRCFVKIFFLPQMVSTPCVFKWVRDLRTSEGFSAYGLAEHMPASDQPSRLKLRV